jgi:glutathione S-transferase
MKLYEMAKAPNPRRVRMFLAEKGLLDKVDCIEMDLSKGENLTPEFERKNPMKKVPVLELENGTCIGETMAICRYFEAAFPESEELLGSTAEEQAIIEQWTRWIDFYLFNPIGMCFQHTTDYFKHRMTPIKEWGEANREATLSFFDFLDKHLANHQFVALERFTIADINAFCTVDFAKVIQLRVDDRWPHLKAWYERMKERDSSRV